MKTAAAISLLFIVYPPQVNGSKVAASERSSAVVLVIAALLYFSQGLPFGIVTELGPLYMRQRGASLGEVGMLTTVSLAWTLKFLWSPLIDRIGTYGNWIRGALVAITWMLAALAFTTSSPLLIVWALLVALSLASATQDIAIDALTIIIVPQRDFGLVNATRITAFRAALIFTGGALAWLSTSYGWSSSFGAAAAIAALILLATFLLPRAEQQSSGSDVVTSLRRWIARREMLPLLAIVALYRIGDAALAPMIKAFWLDRGHSVAEIGTVTTSIGVLFTIAGAFLGGVFIKRFGLLQGLLWLGVAQMLSNIGYALLAQTTSTTPVWYAVAIIENFTGGLGAAAFLSLLMSMAERENAATDFALLSALYRLASVVVGTTSGFASQRIGFAAWFWITVVLGIPGIVVAWAARREVDRLTTVAAPVD